MGSRWGRLGVFGSSEEEATQRFEEAERKHHEIEARPVEEAEPQANAEARSA